MNKKLNNAASVPIVPSKELVDFLHYVENTTDAEAARTDSERIRRIHERVRKVRSSEEVGVKYLRALEEKNEEREEGRDEGREEGREEINRLNAQLIADGRTDDLLKATKDSEYQEKLLEEYRITKQDI